MNQLSIRRLRQLAGKTKNEIADLLGMSVNTYSKYEDNPMSLSYAAYHQLIEYLETAIQIRKKLEKEQPMNTPSKRKSDSSHPTKTTRTVSPTTQCRSPKD